MYKSKMATTMTAATMATIATVEAATITRLGAFPCQSRRKTRGCGVRVDRGSTQPVIANLY
jgi:hypothetical protein